MSKQFKVEGLIVQVYNNRQQLGEAAAETVCTRLRDLLQQQQFVNMIFAAAPSQNEVLSALIEAKDIDWQRVNAFHMDEYIGLPNGAPQKFGSFLKEKLFTKLPFRSVNYIDGNAANAQAECKRYADLLQKYPPDIVCMGIGENGHIAFNDPHVADLDDPLKVKIVDLDMECRQQQVNDGCFDNLEQVPTHAITLTIPALTAPKYIYCVVPGEKKAKAVQDTLESEISAACPASVLRRHASAQLFLDADSASLIKY